MTATTISQSEVAGSETVTVRPRVGNVDVLRGAAALAVLCIHAYALGGRIAPIRAQFWYDVPLINLASGVWLFFGISGYVITRPFIDRLVSGRPLPDAVPYALRRGLRIFPLYWVALAALIAIDGTSGTKTWQLPFHFLLLQNLVPGQEQALFSAAWTLTLEVLFYVSVPLLAVAVGRGGRPVAAERLASLVLGSWVLSIAFTAVADLQGDGQTGLWLRGLLPGMWQMFCPGILLAIAPHLRAPAWRRWLVDFPQQWTAAVVAVFALAGAAILYADAPLRFGVVDYQLLYDASRPLFAIGYGLLIAAALRSAPWGEAAGWVVRLGVISYGVYLLHPVVGAFLLHEDLVPIPHDTLAAFVVNTATLAAVTIPLALISWRWVERPTIELARRLGAAWQRRRAVVVASLNGATVEGPS